MKTKYDDYSRQSFEYAQQRAHFKKDMRKKERYENIKNMVLVVLVTLALWSLTMTLMEGVG